jgi:hypothetical protein
MTPIVLARTEERHGYQRNLGGRNVRRTCMQAPKALPASACRVMTRLRRDAGVLHHVVEIRVGQAGKRLRDRALERSA